MGKKILFVSGSMGLGHVVRDLAIVKKLRAMNPDVEIHWHSEEDVTIRYLTEVGEKSIIQAEHLSPASSVLPGRDSYTANIAVWFRAYQGLAIKESERTFDIIRKGGYDLVIGDEAFDIMLGLGNNPRLKSFPFIFMADWFGGDDYTINLMNRMTTFIFNRVYFKLLTHSPQLLDEYIMIGELEDIPNTKLNFMLPNRRVLAAKYAKCVGYAVPFDVNEHIDKNKIRDELGYGPQPLIVCTKGGTFAGNLLLNLYAEAYPIVKKSIPDAKMVLVSGPMIDPNSITCSEGIIKRGFVPELYKHLAAADFCVSQAGQTTINELIGLQKPFAYFPLKDHFEQQYSERRCERLGAGKGMNFYETTKEMLAERIVNNIGKEVHYSVKNFDGATKAAQIINNHL